jgi:hypothetical protein
MIAYKRTIGKNNADCALPELYKHYKKTIDNPVIYKIYSQFLKEYNSRIMDAIIYENLEYKMPCRLGYLRIQRRRLKPFVDNEGKIVKSHIAPDWYSTKKYWMKIYPGLTEEEIKNIEHKKIIRHNNDHTNGYSTRFFWDKRYSNVKNQSCYIFKATRTAKENLAKFIKKIGLIEYFD